MPSAKRRYGKEEFARRGDEIFELHVRPRLGPEDDGKFVAIDVETGAYELDLDDLEACDKLNARIPDAQTWLVQVGSRYVHRFGVSLAKRRNTRVIRLSPAADRP